MNSHIILGTQFGDEGKGITTDYLANTLTQPLVIRFSGGQQAGHTVVDSFGNRHVFSNFGSGTLRGAPTYWSKYCTFHPNGLTKEYEKLGFLKGNAQKRVKIYVDAMAMVTTPYDILFNQALESARNQKHGSCGVGIGTTVERNTTPYKLYVQDLAHPVILEQKLNAIKLYYDEQVKFSIGAAYYNQWDLEDARKKFLEETKKALDIIEIISEPDMFRTFSNFKNLIFEGSQGILLDMDFGFFPNVTRAHVTSKNAMQILKDFGRNKFGDDDTLNLYYVTRAYQTRHGAGFMTNEHLPLNLKENPLETNVHNEWQTDFRKSVLDIDLLNYALQCDANFHTERSSNKTLVVTCLDQLEGKMQATFKGELQELNPIELGMGRNTYFNTIITSESSCSDNFTKHKRLTL